MQDIPKKRSLTLKGHRTSITLEDAFWFALRDVANDQARSVVNIIEQIDSERGTSSLSSAIRIYVLKYYQNKQPDSAQVANNK